MDMDHSSWDESVVDGLHYLEHTVLQVPFFLMTMMRYITPTLDRMSVVQSMLFPIANPARFMDSLRWVDQTYLQKHQTENPQNLRAMYYPNLEQYPTKAPREEPKEPGKSPLKKAVVTFAVKQGRKAAISL